jgi:diguanylate cyclase (GGDEF)-like protein
MDNPHGVLVRQLSDLGDGTAVSGEWQAFVSAVNSAYWQADFERTALLHALPGLSFRVDREGAVLECHVGEGEDLPLPAAELVGRPLHTLPVEGLAEKLARALSEARQSGAFSSLEYRVEGEDKRRYYEAWVTPLPADQFLIVVRNVTERHELEEALRYQACHDPLTGLPNRFLSRDRLGVAVERARRRDELLCVLLFDLDAFTAINDTLGHAVGDTLLKQVGQRMSRHCRANDTLARVGADEFLYVIDNLRLPEDGGRVAELVLRELLPPFLIEDHELHVSACVGISLFPLDADDPETLIRNADIALVRAKSQGRSSYRLYTPDMNERTLERLRLEARLRTALRREEFVLHYQPQCDAHTGRLTGLEALVRWRQPEGELWPPDAFIGVAEETGLIAELGEWVLHEACSQCARWRSQGYRPVRVAVNLSPRQFLTGRPLEIVGGVLAETGISPRQIEVELTENAIMQNPELGCEVLNAFRSIGLSIAIDDFGTGQSSLSYLKRLPITTLKIDKSFVRECDRNAADGAIVSAIIDMAHSLDIVVIAEGVEDEPQRDFLRARGCDQLQGYLLGRPMDPDSVAKRFLKKSKERVGRALN